jgi:hypothetical protein
LKSGGGSGVGYGWEVGRPIAKSEKQKELTPIATRLPDALLPGPSARARTPLADRWRSRFAGSNLSWFGFGLTPSLGTEFRTSSDLAIPTPRYGGECGASGGIARYISGKLWDGNVESPSPNAEAQRETVNQNEEGCMGECPRSQVGTKTVSLGTSPYSPLRFLNSINGVAPCLRSASTETELM